MRQTVFITGTDTEIGKTFVSTLILKAYNAKNLTTFAMKPIASGAKKDPATGKLYNADALALQAHASIKRPYDVINPIVFSAPIAPHIAAKQEKKELSVDEVKKKILITMNNNANLNLIEGFGGWSVPLNDTMLFSELIQVLAIPVILVVGVKLGCLNHAILTYQEIKTKNIPFLGWVANCLVPETACIHENIQSLKHWIQAPCLGIVPFNCSDPEVLKIPEKLQNALGIS